LNRARPKLLTGESCATGPGERNHRKAETVNVQCPVLVTGEIMRLIQLFPAGILKRLK
jgi:hypothetical protein